MKKVLVFRNDSIKDLEPFILQYLKKKNYYTIFIVNTNEDRLL